MPTKSCLSLLFLIISFQLQAQDYAHKVNPFIGTGGHGHTFPGATVPFGMVQLSPDTRVDGSWDGCGGYHYSDSIIYGFSHTHLSGTGCSDYGDIMLMPVMGTPEFNPDKYASKFKHSSEKANAGYYKVKLEDDNIGVELTASTRTGFHKYTFNNTGIVSFTLDLQHRDKLLDDSIIIINDYTIEGFRRSEAWAKDQRVYFRIEFSKPFYKYLLGNKTTGNSEFMRGKAAFTFSIEAGEEILAKVSLSSVDRAGARNNMLIEIPHWNFNQSRIAAEQLWNKELRKIEVNGGTIDQQTIFYTALYHTFIQPNILNDVDGRYLGRDFKIHQTDGFNYYTVFSIWDTYRAAHPLYNIVQPQRNIDFIKTFLKQYEHSGQFPMWELWSNETDCMIGYHAVSVITDALAKGNTGFNIPLAVEACGKNGNLKKFGIPVFHQNGYLSIEDESESVSKTLEYAYDDWCYLQLLKYQNPNAKSDQTEFQQFAKKGALGWQNIYNTENSFIQPRKNGGWLTPFEPREVNNHFTEANSWQYTFYVPQDVEGMVNLMGGPRAFEKKLDDLFSQPTQTTGRDQADISGQIGQYAHGNEPSHHMAYLYNFIGKPEKTASRVQQILNEMYKNAPDGLAGNEDCGQMSAWYVFSAMGFYPVCPGKNEYIKGNKPIFDEIKINGVPLNELNLNITSYSYPQTNNSASQSISAPVITTSAVTFKDSLKITIQNNGNLAPLMTRIDSTTKGEWQPYYGPFYLKSKATVSAKLAFDSENTQYQSHGYFFKIPNNWDITILSKFNPQYTAGGPGGIIDGIRGYIDWRKGGWQGYQGQDFTAIVDLKSLKNVSAVSLGCLQDTRSWILMPTLVKIEVSEDGKHFKPAGSIENTIADSVLENIIHDYKVSFPAVTARYIKVIAKNYGILPKWHQGAGGEAFIFTDEINVECH